MLDCSICSSTMVPLFETRDYRRPHDETRYAVCWCERCRYGRVAGRFTPEQVSSFYEVDYYTHSESAELSTKGGLLDRLRAHLAWRVDTLQVFDPSEGRGTSLLDVGCGAGDNLARFALRGYSVTGIEPDPSARRVASKYGRVQAGTAEDIPREIASTRYDTILLYHVLEHCIDPKLALQNTRPLIAPGGRLIVEVPNSEARAFRLFRHVWPWTDVPRHLHFFTEQSLRSIFAMSGFRITNVTYVGYVRQFQQTWIKTQEAIWKSIGEAAKQPDFRLAAWRLLASTAFASAPRKYDSVRIHAEVA